MQITRKFDFLFSQKDITVLYLGSRFIKCNIKLPLYFIRSRIWLHTLQNKLPCEVLHFMKEDVKEYMQAFYSKNPDYESIYFDATTKDPYLNNFVMIPPQQKFASNITEQAFGAWGIEIRKKAFGFRVAARKTTKGMNLWCLFIEPTLNCGKIIKN